MFSTDRLLFEDQSAVRERMRDYGSLFKELAVIVPTVRTSSFRETKLSHNVTLYPTRSRGKFSMFFHLYRKGSLLLKTRPDAVITAQDPFLLGLVAYFLSRRFGVPLQLQVHVDFLSPYFRSSVRRYAEQLLAFFLLPRASCVRVVSKRIAESLVRRGVVPERKLVVLPVFVPQPTSSFGPRSGKRVRVLMYSRLEAEKDIPLGIRAFAAIRETVPDARLAIAGSGSERNALQELVEKLGLAESVSFLGWQDRGSMGDLLSRADIFLNTSRYEGYGRTLAEAALLERAIVTTDVGLVGDVLSPGEARVCSVGDERCLSEALIELAKNPQLRKSLGAAARKSAESKLLAENRAYLRAFQNSFTLCQKAL
jgi:glycosyltransferase involved in cell wall biosynthesis